MSKFEIGDFVRIGKDTTKYVIASSVNTRYDNVDVNPYYEIVRVDTAEKQLCFEYILNRWLAPEEELKNKIKQLWVRQPYYKEYVEKSA